MEANKSSIGCKNLCTSPFTHPQLGATFGQAVDPFKPAEEIVFGVLQGLAGGTVGEKSKAE